MRSCLFFYIVLLLCFFAQNSALEPKMIGRSEIYLERNWTMVFEGELPDEVNLNVYYLADTPFQTPSRIYSNRNYSIINDGKENKMMKITFKPKEKTEVVVVETTVKVNYLAARESTGKNAEEYLAPSRLVLIDEDIRTEAQRLASNASTNLEKLVVVTDWVHNYLRYDKESAENRSYDSEWVYRNRVGVCDEFSHLLLALLRAVGIPARFVAGFVNSGKEWGPHAWVEAEINGEWVAADPTYNEAVFLDATHVKFATGRDNDDIKLEITAKPSSYDIKEIKSPLHEEVYGGLVEASNFPELLGIHADFPREWLGEGTIARINATLSGKGFEFGAPVSVTLPEEIILIGGKDQLVYLPPDSTQELAWKIVLPAKMEKNFVYTFPIEISTLGKKISGNVTGRKEGEQRFEEGINITDIRVSQDAESILVGISVRNTGNVRVTDAKVSVYADVFEVSKSLDLNVGESKDLNFSFKKRNVEKIGCGITITWKNNKVFQPFEIQVIRRDITGNWMELTTIFALALVLIFIAAIIYITMRR